LDLVEYDNDARVHELTFGEGNKTRVKTKR